MVAPAARESSTASMYICGVKVCGSRLKGHCRCSPSRWGSSAAFVGSIFFALAASRWRSPFAVFQRVVRPGGYVTNQRGTGGPRSSEELCTRIFIIFRDLIIFRRHSFGVEFILRSARRIQVFHDPCNSVIVHTGFGPLVDVVNTEI